VAGNGDMATLPCVVRVCTHCPVALGMLGMSGMSESVKNVHSKATAHACLTPPGGF